MATTNQKEVFELAKTIGNVAGTSNFLRLVQPIVNSESLSISKSVASIAATIMGESPTFIRNLKEIQANLGQIINTKIDWNVIAIPGLSEEAKKKRIEAYRQWGAYGWTVIPHANFKQGSKRKGPKLLQNKKANGRILESV